MATKTWKVRLLDVRNKGTPPLVKVVVQKAETPEEAALHAIADFLAANRTWQTADVAAQVERG